MNEYKNMVKISIILLLIVSVSNVFSQNWPDSTDISKFSGFYSFRMGELESEYVPKNINIRANNFTTKHLKTNNYSLKISNPFFHPDALNLDGLKPANLLIETLANQQEDNRKPKINYDYTSTKNSSQFLLALGKTNLSPSAMNKIKHLYLIPDFGIPDLSSFNNLKSLSLDDSYYRGGVFLNFYTDPRKYLYTSYHKYLGELNFFNEILSIESLNFLKLNFERNLGEITTSERIFLSNELKEEIFQSGNLQNLSLKGIQFLPIDYYNMKNLQFIEVSSVYFPELLNLSLLFQQEKRDTSEGNWHFLLKNLVDEKRSVINISNGQVRTFYKNGQLLSLGEMINNKPNGEWKFWYPDGKLCEERHYENGIRTGKWTFMNPKYYWIDTSLILLYNNGDLVNRKDFSMEYVNPYCYETEIRLSVYCSSELIIHISTADSTNISIRRNIGKREILETLSNNNQYWKYEKIEKCEEQKFQEVKLSGLKNEISNYFEKKTFSWYKDKIFRQTFFTLDLLNCNVQHILYEIDWETQKVDITQETNSKILPEYWDCEN